MEYKNINIFDLEDNNLSPSVGYRNINIFGDTKKIDVDKPSESLYEKYNKKENIIDSSGSEYKNINIFDLDKGNLNVDFEDNPARLYGEKPKTDIINDIRYGWNQSQAGFYHLVGNVPGGLDAIKDFAGRVTGIDYLDGDGILANMKGFLEERADLTSPEYLGLDAPDELVGKVLAGFAMVPITLAEYYAPTKLLKSVPLAMALIDGLRESDKGLMEASIAAGKGAIMGNIIQASNVLRLPERMGALGILGYATAGGNTEDRIAGGIVFGALGVLGPVKGKTLSDVKRSVLNRKTELDLVREQKVKDWEIFHSKEQEAIKLINEQQSKVDNLKDKKSTKNKKEYGEANTKLDTLLEIQNNIRKNKETIERVLYTTEKIAPKLLAMDSRKSVEIRTDLFDLKGNKKYEDLSTKGKIASYLFPGKFSKNPINKWTADFLGNTRISIENKIDSILFDYKVTPFKTGEIKRDASGVLKFGGISALKNIQTSASEGAALTRTMKLYEKDWRKLEHVIKESFKIGETKTKKEVKEITDAELKTQYKFDKEQINVYRDLRKGMDNVHVFYNEYINKYVKTIPDATGKKIAKELPYLPRYMPHMFLGDFRVWVNKKSAPMKDPVQVIPANNLWSANTIKKDLQTKFGKDHIVRVKSKNSQNVTNKEVGAFEDAMRYAERLGKTDAAKEIHDLYIKTVSTKGFRKHSVRRKSVPGQAGSRGQPGTKEGLQSVLDFLEGYRVYVRGGVQKAYAFKARKETNEVLNNQQVITNYPNARNIAVTYRENALGAQGNKVTEVVQNVSRKWVGENGIGNILGTANRLTLNLKLLFLNPRFITAQYIQPFQMIPAKLLHLQSKGEKGKMWEAVIEAQKSLHTPNKKTIEFVEYMAQQRVVEPKFLQEFVEGEFTAGRFKKAEKFHLNTKVLDFVGNVATGKKLSGYMEQYSRLNAGLMFYHFGIKAGKTQEKAMKDAAYNADRYMVEYNSYERPMLYGDAGLGIVGKSLGLFKTFQHNYFAQLTEHFTSINFKEIKKGDLSSTKSSFAFLGTMILTAGMLNVIGIEIADKLITGLTPTWERLFGKRPQTVTEALLESDLPEWAKWGVPSSAIGYDITTTLAAPGLGFSDVISAPSLELLGLHPGQLNMPLFKDRKGGVIQTTSSLAYRTTMGMATESDWQKVFKSVAPTSFQGVIEAYYSTGSIGDAGKVFVEDKGAYGTLVRDPFKKDRGKIRRDMKDWRARLFASYSIRESQTLKTIYQLSVIDRTASANQQSVVRVAAHHLVNGMPLPRYLFDMSLANNVGLKSFQKQIQNRIKLMNTTLIDREMKSKNILRRDETFDMISNL